MQTNILTEKKYKNAFNCKRCPQTSNESGCPAWWEQMWTDQATGEQALNKGCGFFMAQAVIVSSANEARRPAAEISAMREEIKDGVQRATTAVLEFYKQKAMSSSPEDVGGHYQQEFILGNGYNDPNASMERKDGK